jgi:hypothetical protein
MSGGDLADDVGSVGDCSMPNPVHMGAIHRGAASYLTLRIR